MRRYKFSDKPLYRGYAVVTKDGEAKQLFSIVRKGSSDILVPFGDLCEEHLGVDAAWSLETFNDPIDFKTLDLSGNHVSLEPIGEFGCAPPELLPCDIGSLILAGGFLAVAVRFREGDDVDDSIILVKDLLLHYDFAAKLIYPVLELLVALQNSRIFNIDISDFQLHTIALSESSPISFSPNNYLVKKPFADNFDDIVIRVESIVGPYRPDSKHAHFKMYMADFLTFSSESHKPDAYSPIKLDLSEKVIIPKTSPQALLDFNAKLDFEISQNNEFKKSRHYESVLKLKTSSKDEIAQEITRARREVKTEIDRVSGFAKKQKTQERKDATFRYIMACEAQFLLYGIKTSDAELGICVG
jgi:hypothetical protein